MKNSSMANEKTRSIAIIICSTLLGAVGQFFFKYSFISEFFLFISLGLIAYIASTVLYFYVLSRTHLSWAYSMGGLSYIFAVILANFIEEIPFLRWIGVIVIAAGIFLIGIS
ncbi:hypothetical protein M1614_03145 [Candidatus Marsarchaeota archaeon]|nr:hypothetical protein [Candidatus Marsarchaeota archaeon]